MYRPRNPRMFPQENRRKVIFIVPPNPLQQSLPPLFQVLRRLSVQRAHRRQHRLLLIHRAHQPVLQVPIRPKCLVMRRPVLRLSHRRHCRQVLLPWHRRLHRVQLLPEVSTPVPPQRILQQRALLQVRFLPMFHLVRRAQVLQRLPPIRQRRLLLHRHLLCPPTHPHRVPRHLPVRAQAVVRRPAHLYHHLVLQPNPRLQHSSCQIAMMDPNWLPRTAATQVCATSTRQW
mmetsp:Transcript_27520/g.64510  ORF Transcript_27520/g.64510 Transcript_27520/m.64510 type:complete len:230 (-) Transcript_27520:1707-2396(-)